jgi:soluble P-type ATPase
MDDTHELVDFARDSVDEIIALAGALLRSGADIELVHRKYVVPALELLADVETQALLASADDRGAHEVLRDTVVKLEHLRSKAHAERKRHADGDCE